MSVVSPALNQASHPDPLRARGQVFVEFVERSFRGGSRSGKGGSFFGGSAKGTPGNSKHAGAEAKDAMANGVTDDHKPVPKAEPI